MAVSVLHSVWRDLRSPLYRNTLYLFATDALTGGLGFLFWIVAARLVSSADVGLAAVGLSTAGFLGYLAHLGLGDGLVRFLPDRTQDAPVMINCCLTLSAGAGVVGGVVFVLGIDLWASPLAFLRHDVASVFTFLGLVVPLAALSSIDGVFIARRQAQYVFWRSALVGLRVPLLAVLAGFGALGILGSVTLALVIATAVMVFLFLPRVEPAYHPRLVVRKRVLNDLLHFSVGNYAAVVMTMIPAGLVPLMIVSLLNPASVAHFYVALMMVGLLYLIPGAAAMSLFAEGSQPLADFPKDAKRSAWLIALLLAPGILLFLIFGDFLLGLFGVEYASAAGGLLRLLALGGILVAVNRLYVARLRVEKRIRLIVGLTALATGLILGVSVVLLPTVGIAGVGIAFIVGEGGMTAYVLLERIRRSVQRPH